MRNILEIKNLVVSYGGIEAVKGIDLKVEEGKLSPSSARTARANRPR